MHLTRPKSSKGRSRPAASSFLSSRDPESTRGPSDCAASSRPDRSFRSRSQPDMWQARKLTDQDVFHMLQGSAAAPSQSLNKYKVLPSIGNKQPEESLGKILNKTTPRLDRADDAVTRIRSSEEARTAGPHRVTPEPSDEGRSSCNSLLLAVRAPCGRRFQQHFSPADTLLAVRVSAEARSGTRFGEVSIETMDVPRRTFTNLNMTLDQCGILNRSVLCISYKDDYIQEE
ncbi:UBX domain-containing protein 10 [Xenentodon cancila]